MTESIELQIPVDVVISGRIAKKYVHYDYDVFFKGRHIGEARSRRNESEEGNEGIFPCDVIEKYITSEDKKTFRKSNWGFQEYISWEFFDVCGLKFFCMDQEFLDLCGIDRPFCKFMNSKFGCYNIITHDVNIIAVIPVKICPTCGDVFHNEENMEQIKFSKYEGKPLIQFKRCSCCASHGKKTLVTTYLSAANHSAFFRDISKRDPRAFLYEKKTKPKKSYFKKYISRHLNRVRKLRPISQKEVSFFRSWLGVKELAALAN
jgi:hypothetical protein